MDNFSTDKPIQIVPAFGMENSGLLNLNKGDVVNLNRDVERNTDAKGKVGARSLLP
jgi:hypothetical protein